jgi:hypothetical protein
MDPKKEKGDNIAVRSIKIIHYDIITSILIEKLIIPIEGANFHEKKPQHYDKRQV